MPTVIDDIITTKTLAVSEASRLDSLTRQLNAAEKAIADTKEAIKVSISQLNREICALKVFND